MQKLAMVVMAAALAVPAGGQAAEGTKAREKAAKKACASGDFRKGVEILSDLYVDTDDVTFVYNQGRCYEQNHQWVSAMDRFREYLRKSPNATASDKAETEKHIADCEALREREEPRPAQSPLTPPLPPAPVVLQAPAPSPPEPPATVVQPSTPPGTGMGSALRVTGIVVGSAGIAAAVGGLVLNLKANSLADDFNRTHSLDTRSSYSSYKTGSMICYGAGAGMVAAGVVLYLVGRSPRGGETTTIAFIPTITPEGFSLGMRRAF
jgi:hypothetical protein